MRKLVTALAAGTALCGSGMLAHAAAPEDREPQARAYLNFEFGGQRAAPHAFFYGLRMDQGARSMDAPVQPAFAVLEFDRGGFSSARVNGVPLAAPSLRLNQAGETQWTWTDYGLLVAGIVGLGFVVAEVADAEDESEDPPSGSTTGGDAGGETTGGTTGGDPGTCLPGPPLCLPFDGGRGDMGETARLLDLDGGTGYMGDLIAEQ